MSSLMPDQLRAMAQASIAAQAGGSPPAPSPFSAPQQALDVRAPVSTMSEPYPAPTGFADALPAVPPPAPPVAVEPVPEQGGEIDFIGAADEALAGAAGRNAARYRETATNQEFLNVEQGAAARAVTDAESAQARAKIAPTQELAEATAQWAAVTKEAFNRSQAAIKKQMTAYQVAVEDASKAQLHDFFADKTTAGRVMGIVAAALGGAANGLAGRPGAPTALDRIIDRDMDMQKSNLFQKNQNVQNQAGLLQQMISTSGSEQAGRVAMMDAIRTKVAAQINYQIARTDDPLVRARGKKALADIDASTVMNRERLNESWSNNASVLAAKEADVMMAGERFQTALAGQRHSDEAEGRKAMKEQVELNVKRIPGVKDSEFLDSKTHEALQKQIQGAGTALRILKQLDEHPDLLLDVSRRKQALVALQASMGVIGARALNNNLIAALEPLYGSTFSRLGEKLGATKYHENLRMTQDAIKRRIQATVGQNMQADGKTPMTFDADTEFGDPK